MGVAAAATVVGELAPPRTLYLRAQRHPFAAEPRMASMPTATRKRGISGSPRALLLQRFKAQWHPFATVPTAPIIPVTTPIVSATLYKEH